MEASQSKAQQQGQPPGKSTRPSPDASDMAQLAISPEQRPAHPSGGSQPAPAVNSSPAPAPGHPEEGELSGSGSATGTEHTYDDDSGSEDSDSSSDSGSSSGSGSEAGTCRQRDAAEPGGFLIAGSNRRLVELVGLKLDGLDVLDPYLLRLQVSWPLPSSAGLSWLSGLLNDPSLGLAHSLVRAVSSTLASAVGASAGRPMASWGLLALCGPQAGAQMLHPIHCALPTVL